MQVINALACLRSTVENQTVAVPHHLALISDPVGYADQHGDYLCVFSPEVVDRRYVLPWNHQHVDRRDRLYILEGDHVVVPV